MSELSRITNNAQRSSLELRVFTSPVRVIAGDPNRTFSPTTSTLIFGQQIGWGSRKAGLVACGID
jgi:hypothetical protein